MSKKPTHKCLNCDSSFDFEFKHCPDCGQKNTDGRITFSELWAEFQDAVFNIDSRTWRTFVNIFIPGKLTLEYFEGKHRQFVHPLRVLIVTSLLIIIAMSYQDFQSRTNHKFVIKDRIAENYERQRLNTILEKIVDNTNVIYPEERTKIITDTIISTFHDSLYSLLHTYGDKYGDSIDINEYISFTNESTEYIHKRDFMTKTLDELVDKYKKNEGILDRLLFRQKAKYIKDETQLAKAMISSISWAIILLMPFVAFVLYLLFGRKFYFIENLIFTFHVHAFSFILIAIYILGINTFPERTLPFVIFIIQVFLFFAMWKVYGQSIFMTLLKQFILTISYFVLFIVFIVGTFFISFLLL